MARDEARDKNAATEKKRLVSGPRAIATLLPSVTKPAFRARSAATAQVIADWVEIVGPALAATTQPRRLSGSTLSIVCAGPVALELQHLTETLAQRINGHFGRTLVEQFRFVQGTVALEQPRSKRRPTPPIEIPDMAPGELRDALAKLGAAVRQARSRERASLGRGNRGHKRAARTRSRRSAMTPTRRTLLATLATLPMLPAARAQPQDDPRMTDRAIGNADAKVTVQEYFSLTCTHCAAFQKETFPKVKAELIDTGKIRYIWRDYPLDQLALFAAMIARTLPPERYEPFISALLTTQDRWAFTRSANPMEELMKLATLAGMSRDTYDKTVRDEALKQFILTEQADGEKKYTVNSTPTFVINDKPLPGAVAYDTFLQAVEAASGA